MEEREQRSSHGPEADALLEEVRAAVATLAALLGHRARLDRDVVAEIQATVQEVERRLDRKALAVVVVGEKGAGKSTFLNALLGERILGVGARDPNAVTFLRRAPSPSYRARFADGTVEDFARVAPDHSEELAAGLAPAEASLAAAESDRAEARQREAGAVAELEREEAALAEARRAFEARRDESARLEQDLVAAEEEAARIEATAAARERALPAVVRTRPAAWALWLWVLRAFALVFAWGRWRAFEAIAGDRARARDRIAGLRLAASTAAGARRSAEEELAPRTEPAEAARARLSDARRNHEEALERVKERSAVAEAARRELERHREERQRRFLGQVRVLSDAGGRGKDVIELEIDYPARHLPDGVIILDTPGVTAESAPVRERAWNVIRERADGCILLSELQRAVSGPTKAFLQQVRTIVPHVLLVLTKMDQAFTDALHKGGGEPWEAVEKARRIATRRFAREVGRDPGTVLSVAIAAEPALKKGEPTGLGRRFVTETGKLFQLLRHERALILGVRAGGLLRSSMVRVVEAEERAERAYEERIAALEASRVPEPERFRAQELEAAAPLIEEKAAAVTAAALDALREGIASLRGMAVERIERCSRPSELQALAPSIEETLREGVRRLEEEIEQNVEAGTERATHEIEGRVFEDLRRRYEIAHQVTRSSSSAIQLAAPAGAWQELGQGLDRRFAAALTSFRRARLGFGVGGALAGALIGTALLPGLGTAAGAALGALLALASRLDRARRRCVEGVLASLRGPEAALGERLRSAEPARVTAMSARLERSTEQALVRFARWIAEPLEAERAAISEQRMLLEDLRAVRARLEQHDPRLAALTKAAADASLGLCR